MLMTSSMMAGNNGAIIEEWSQCVKSMGVSSRESWAYRLTDGTSSYWQSCGTQGKHWIRLEMNPDVLIHSLRVQVIFLLTFLRFRGETFHITFFIIRRFLLCGLIQ